MNSKPLNQIVPDPDNEFAHYSKAAEKMENIQHFFDYYFLLNIAKLVIYFLAMPLSLPDYSADAIGFHLILSAAEIFCLLASSYNGIFIKNCSKSRLASIAMILTEIVFFFMNPHPFTSVTHYFTLPSIMGTVYAIIKLNDVEYLSTLKGFPNFSEMTDNPNFVPTNLPFAYLPKNAMKNTVAKQFSVSSKPADTSMDSLEIPVNIPDNFNDKAFGQKSAPAAKSDDIEYTSPEAGNTVIPPAWCTPSEERLLGNANISSSYQMTEDMYTPPKKKVNLSKDKKGNQ